MKSTASQSIRISDSGNSRQHEDSTAMDSDNQLSQSSLNTGESSTSDHSHIPEETNRLMSADSIAAIDIGYKVYSRRWGILAQFCGLILANATLWVTFAPISNTAEEYFGTAGTTTRVNMLAVVFLIMYPVGTALEVYCMQRYKLRATLLIGGSLSVVGSLIRLIAALMHASWGLSDSATYALVLVGQVAAALAQPLFLNCPAYISSAWFPPSERDISTSCGSLFSPLGNAVGSVLPIFFVTETNSSDKNIDGMVSLMLVECLLCIVTLVVAYLYFEAAPPTAPSYSALLKNANRDQEPVKSSQLSAPSERLIACPPGSAQKFDDFDLSGNSNTNSSAPRGSSAARSHLEYGDLVELSSRHSAQEWSSTKEQLRFLRNNKNYVYLFVGFCMGLGLFTALLTFINQLVLPYGYSNDDAGTLGGCLLFTGLFGAAIVSLVLEKTKAYETTLKTGFFCCAATIMFMITQLKPDNFFWLCFSFCLMGFALLPMLPTVIENAAECTYPDVTEDLSVGLLFMGGNVVGIAITMILETLLSNELTKYGIVYEPNADSSTGHPASSMSGLNSFVRPSNIFMLSIIGVSILFLMQYTGDYRRLKAERMGTNRTISQADSSYQPPMLDTNHNNSSEGRGMYHQYSTDSAADRISNRPSSLTTISDDDVLTAISTNYGGKDHYSRTGTLTGTNTAGNSFQWGLSDLGTLSQRETIVINQTTAAGDVRTTPAKESSKNALQRAFMNEK